MTRSLLISFLLLFAAYTTFSWFLTHSTANWFAWSFISTFALLQALLLTTWFIRVRLFFGRWLASDVGYFTLIIVGALSVTAALVWFKVFGYVLVLVSAEILARLELQRAGCNRLQAFLLLTLVSLLGVVAGWSASFSPFFRFS
jgi:hypothetical protein